MKLWDNALNGLSEKMVEELEEVEPRTGTGHWIKWIGISAAALMLVSGLSMLPEWIKQEAFENAPAPSSMVLHTTHIANEIVMEEYKARIAEGNYRDYMAGRAVEARFVGEFLEEITVEAGWQNGSGEAIGEKERLRARVYALRDIPPEKAVCLQYLDKGDALTTEHYYCWCNSALSPEELNALAALLWVNLSPDPGPAANGTVTGYSQPFIPTTGAAVGE